MAILESVASSKRKIKEGVRLDNLIPRQLREESEMLIELMNSYYEFMNLFAYYYKKQDQVFYATVIDEGLIFRTESNEYFFDESIEFTKLYDTDGNEIQINPIGSYIAGTDNLPLALEEDLSSYGRLFFINTNNLSEYNFKQLKLVTPVIVYAGDSPSYTVGNILEQRDIDTIRQAYLEMLQKEIAASIPRNLQSDKKLLYKNIAQFYRERGSVESIKVFFRLLLNDEVEVTYPGDQMLIPSAGDWDATSPARVPEYDDQGNLTGYVQGFGTYLDQKGQISNDKIRIQDSNFYQKFSYLIRTGSNLDLWGNAFNKLIHPAGFKFFGEVAIFINLVRNVVDKRTDYNITNAMMPHFQPGFIGAEDVSIILEFISTLSDPKFKVNVNRSAQVGTVKIVEGSVNYVEITDRGYGYETAPTITIEGDGTGVVFDLELDENGSIKTTKATGRDIAFVEPTNSGSGFTGTATASITTNPNEFKINSIEILDKGYRYSSGLPEIVISAPDLQGGVQATAEACLCSKSRLSSINITNEGSGYVIPPTVTVIGKQTRVSEFLPEIIISPSAVEGHKEEVLNRGWKDLLHFFDTTPMYAYADYTFFDLENEITKIHNNIGTEINLSV